MEGEPKWKTIDPANPDEVKRKLDERMKLKAEKDQKAKEDAAAAKLKEDEDKRQKQAKPGAWVMVGIAVETCGLAMPSHGPHMCHLTCCTSDLG